MYLRGGVDVLHHKDHILEAELDGHLGDIRRYGEIWGDHILEAEADGHLGLGSGLGLGLGLGWGLGLRLGLG